jgi:hypothetical protein
MKFKIELLTPSVKRVKRPAQNRDKLATNYAALGALVFEQGANTHSIK